MGLSHAGGDPPCRDAGSGARESRPRSGHLQRTTRGRDRGFVTSETAVALPSLFLVALMLMWSMSLVTAQLQCVDAARAGARVVSRGETEAASEAAALAAAPDGAVVTISRSGDFIRVRVSVKVSPAGGLVDLLPAMEVHGEAHAISEEALGSAIAGTAPRSADDAAAPRLLAGAVAADRRGGWP